MEHLKDKTLTNLPDHVDYTLLWQFVIATAGIVTTVIYTVNKYFAAKDKEKQEFIESVVKATIDSSLTRYQTEYRSEINEFKREMNIQVASFNKTVVDIYKEIRKA